MTVGFDQFEKSIAGSSVPVVPGRARPRGFYRNIAKRGFDILFVLLTLPVTIPVIGLVSLAVSIDGGRPIYTSVRVGRDGRLFRMFKLRTMFADAERNLSEHLSRNPEALAEWNTTQKLKSDPRVTRIGRILRKTSLDELPQVLNVLKGDMSIVGPRPMLPEQRSLYPGYAYYALRPGLTGLWQVSARNSTSFEARSDYDHRYDKELSLSADIMIIARTVAVVLKGTGY